MDRFDRAALDALAGGACLTPVPPHPQDDTDDARAVLAVHPEAWALYSRDDEWWEVNGRNGVLGINRTRAGAWKDARASLEVTP